MAIVLEKEKLLIKNTTREQREKFIKGAISIGSLDAPMPDEETLKLYNKYINGTMELEDVKQKIIESIKK